MIFRILLLLAMLTTLLGCSADGKDRKLSAISDPCQSLGSNYVCEVQFERVYVNSELLAGRNIKLDGIIVVGMDALGHEEMAIFPSAERANLCNLIYALRLKSDDKAIVEEVRLSSGMHVQVAGKFNPGNARNDFWGEINLIRPPSLISGVKHDLSCLNMTTKK